MPELYETLLDQVHKFLEEGKQAEHELGNIRATLLVNFGKDSPHNRYPIWLEDNASVSTHQMMVLVLEKLTTLAGYRVPSEVSKCEKIEHSQRSQQFTNGATNSEDISPENKIGCSS